MASHARSALVLVLLPAAALFLGIWVASTVLPHASAFLRVRSSPPLGWKSLTQLSGEQHVGSCEDAALAAVRWAVFFSDWTGDASLRGWIHRHPDDSRFRLLPPYWLASRPSEPSSHSQGEDQDQDSQDMATCLTRYGQGPTDRQRMDTSEAKLLLDLDYLSHRQSIPACVVFSIGGNAQTAFEQSLLNSTKCQVFQFDCTVSEKVMEPIIADMGHPGRFFFYSLCVGRHAIDEAAQPVPVRVSYDQRGHTDTILHSMAYLVRSVTGLPAINVLKFDAESAEHDGIVDMLADFQSFAIPLPEQISMEVHMFKQGEMDTFTYLQLFQRMFDAGYVLVSMEPNPLGRHCCMEFTFALGCGIARKACGYTNGHTNGTRDVLGNGTGALQWMEQTG